MSRNETIIFDGYNVIHRVAALRECMDSSLERARERLISMCTAWKAANRPGAEMVIVFDGSSAVGGDRAQSGRGVRVVYTATGEDADERIMAIVRDLEGRSDCTVVSDDNYVSTNCRALGASMMRVSEFGGHTERRKTRSVSARRADDGATKDLLTGEERRKINEDLKKAFGIK